MKNYFRISEFTAQGFPENPSAEQRLMLYNLRDGILNPIRAEISASIIIVDCCRGIAEYNTLIKKGYHPSKTSDHFWGNVITETGTDGKTITSKYSVGAVDFYCPRRPMDDVFKVVREMAINLQIKPGQVILEKGFRGKWIHISNPKNLVYADSFIEEMRIAKARFLTSSNNGKTYNLAA